jgi:phage terminase large subunit-like protein
LGAAEQLSTEALAAGERRLKLIKAGRDYARSHQREFPMAWYPWQRRAIAATADHSEVMVLAANQVGKTVTEGYIVGCWATGDYPADWEGVRFEYPTIGWVFGVDNTQLRDVFQKEILGTLQADDTFSGGWIHPDEVVGFNRSQTPGLVKDVMVKFRGSDQTTVISFKTYTQSKTGSGSLPMAGSRVDWIVVDEQPPDDIRGQLKARTINGRKGLGGVILYGMTPERGMTELVREFMENPAPHRALIGPVPWEDAPHITASRRDELLSAFPPHERDMRAKGIPLFGTGRIFTPDESTMIVKPFNLAERPWLKCIRAIDVGINPHPTAIAWMAYDPEEGVFYLVRVHRQAGQIPAVHAATANSLWANAPLVLPHDASATERGSGKTVKQFYQEAGITNAIDFKNPDGTNYVEPGIMAMQQAMELGLFRVFEGQCQAFIDEQRTYHRDDKGRIVKDNDDAIDAVRYAFQTVQQYGALAESREQEYAGSLSIDWGL